MLIFKELLNLFSEGCDYVFFIIFPYFLSLQPFQLIQMINFSISSRGKNQQSGKAPSLRVIPVNCAAFCLPQFQYITFWLHVFILWTLLEISESLLFGASWYVSMALEHRRTRVGSLSWSLYLGWNSPSFWWIL